MSANPTPVEPSGETPVQRCPFCEGEIRFERRANVKGWLVVNAADREPHWCSGWDNRPLGFETAWFDASFAVAAPEPNGSIVNLAKIVRDLNAPQPYVQTYTTATGAGEPSGAGMPEWVQDKIGTARVFVRALDQAGVPADDLSCRTYRALVLLADENARLTRERAEAVQAAERSDRILLDRMMDAALAREDEREACAQIADEEWAEYDGHPQGNTRAAAQRIRTRIRSRSTPTP